MERIGGKERRKEEEEFWLTYFTCQGGAGMLNRVVTIHAYSIHMGTYGTVYTVHSVCVYVV